MENSEAEGSRNSRWVVIRLWKQVPQMMCFLCRTQAAKLHPLRCGFSVHNPNNFNKLQVGAPLWLLPPTTRCYFVNDDVHGVGSLKDTPRFGFSVNQSNYEK